MMRPNGGGMNKIKTIVFLLLIAVIFAGAVSAQETYFGKNKVRYKDFDWSFIQTRHFDIYFYEDAYETAKFASTVMESAYVEISNELDYKIQHRVPVFVYNSHNDFQQTNITPGLLPEQVGGFTEAFKNRIVIPFTGSYEDFRHVLHHELTHAVVYDLIYGHALSSLISRRRLFVLPLWYAEGFAEYSSRHGWDYFSDMFVRDATINGYLAPPEYLGGFLAYKQGQAMIKYIADKYGEDKLGEIIKKGKAMLSLGKAMKAVIGIDEKEFWEDFSREMKRRYWPEIAKRKEVDEIAKPLTRARKDGSYYNEKPAFSPNGDRLAIYTDRSDYTEIIMISAIDGEKIASLVKSERSGDLESLHSYVSGLSFSPDGEKLVFVAKSKGKESLFLYDVRKRETYKKIRTNYYNILSPAWSPDGSQIAFSALKGYKRDLFIYDIEANTFVQLTNDRHDDVNPSWIAGTNELVFSSDRPHPQSYNENWEGNLYVDSGAYMPGDFEYGFYNLFRINLSSLKVEPIDVGPGQNKDPQVSPDGRKIAFVSDRNGIDNIYVSYLDSAATYPVTDILTGVFSISWAPEGDKIAFSAFNKGGFDIFILKDLLPQGEDGKLAVTDFVAGEYNLLASHNGPADTVRAGEVDSSLITAPIADEYATYPVDSTLTDSTQASAADSAKTEDSDSVTESGLQGDEYVFVSHKKQKPYDEYMVDVNSDSSRAKLAGQEEPASFDSIPGPNAEGEFKVRPYKVKFTPDFIGGGFTYDTFFGVRGQTYFVFSDYLGNHQIYIATDLVNTIDQSNIQAYYFYNKKRTSLGVGLFHTKNFYEDTNYYLFSDRLYGAQFLASRPSSKFSRVQFVASQSFIDRKYIDILDTREDRSTKVTTGELSYVFDNIIWGITGPINGRRAKLTLTGGVNLFNSKDLEFTSAELDYRKYWHFAKLFSFAFRISGGASFGRTPKLYFLGGTTNWIGTRTLDEKVYKVENLYFSDVVTPLRGIPYYDLSGDRYGLINLEFRFPMIDYFAMRFPLPLVLSRVQGVIFSDYGAAWYGDNFKGATSQNGPSRLQDIKSGFGFGMRANLGFLVLRYDLAWATDYDSVSDKPTSYFSFGADF